MKTTHLIYTRSNEDWLRFRQRYPQWRHKSSHYPLLCITPRALTPDDHRLLSAADILLLTSQHALDTLLLTYRPNPNQTCVAIGEKTAASIAHSCPNNPCITAPAPYNSEALLTQWHPKGKRIAIIAAPEGRTLLKQQLDLTNHCTTIYTYYRSCPHSQVALPYRPEAHNILIITSAKALNCLQELCPQTVLKLLQYRASIAAISPRLAELARLAGFQQVFSAQQANEATLMACIGTWQSQLLGTLENPIYE